MSNISIVIDGVSNSGGTDRVLSLLANSLTQRGHKIHVHSLSLGEPYYPIVKEVTLHYYSNPRLFSLVSLLIELKKTNHTVLIISMGKLSVQVSILAKLLGLKNRLICSDHVSINSFNPLVKRLKIFCYNLYDKVVVLNKNDFDYLKNKIYDKNKLSIIRNISPFDGLDKYHKYRSSSKTIISIGRLSYQKNFSRLIDLWRQSDYKDWELIIIGDGEEFVALNRLIALHKLKNVKLVPATREITSFYSKASLLLMTSRYEGLPMVLIEAKNFGIPVLAFDCKTGPSEIIDGDGVLVDYKDNDSFIRKLNGLMCDSATRMKLSKKAHENSKFYSSEFIIKQWDGILYE